jgi:hypothetical protein
MNNQNQSNQINSNKFCLDVSNKTEQLLVDRIRDCNDGWMKVNNTHREFRIGVQTNCNGEITKNHKNHLKTGDEIIAFFNKNNVEISLETINTEDEYSNQIKIENDIYDKLEKIILMKK